MPRLTEFSVDQYGTDVLTIDSTYKCVQWTDVLTAQHITSGTMFGQSRCPVSVCMERPDGVPTDNSVSGQWNCTPVNEFSLLIDVLGATDYSLQVWPRLWHIYDYSTYGCLSGRRLWAVRNLLAASDEDPTVDTE